MINKGGRPTCLSPLIKKTLIEGVKDGLTLKAACKAADISYSTLAAWYKKARAAIGKNEPDDYSDLITCINAERSCQWDRHRARVNIQRKARDFRYGWKKPMTDETKQKLRTAAFRRAIEEVISR